MPAYRYNCDDCDVEFEELLLKQDEIKEYYHWHPCPKCSERAERIKFDRVSFKFNSDLPIGNTGIHAVDYPMLDVAIGRTADKKREVATEKKKTRDKKRKELGTNYISEVNGETKSLTKRQMKDRDIGFKLLDKAKKNQA